MGIERIRNWALRQRVTTAEDAAQLIHNGDIIGTSGFTAVGYPKAIPAALAQRAENGEDLGLTVIVGGNAGEQLDGVLGRSGVLRRRYGYQSNDFVRTQTNADNIKYIDMHVSHVPFYVKNGYLGHINTAIFEIAGIDEGGNLIPACAVGIMDVLAQCADNIILEINDTVPEEIAGMHDIYTPQPFPHTLPIPILHPGDRIGVPYVKCDPEKIKAIVLTHEEDSNKDLMAPNEEMRLIADHLLSFLKDEMRVGRLPTPLPPLQSGVGGVANAVLMELAKSDLTDLSVYTEVMQDAVLDLIDSGKVQTASGTAITVSPSRRADFYRDLKKYQGKIIIRPQEISNSPEVILRLGAIAMNTAIEVDLGGNVNSTHIGTAGDRIMNGIGGSNDYARNSGLSIFTTASTAKNGTISCIVPHVSHVDHTEHDTQIIVTEQGIADLRGLSAYERADLLIERCVHPKFRDELRAYRDKAYREGGARHAISRL